MPANDVTLSLEKQEKEIIIRALKKNKKLEPAEILKTEKARKAQESVLVRKEEAENLAEEFSQRQGNRNV